MFDTECRFWDNKVDNTPEPLAPVLRSKEELQKKAPENKLSLNISAQKILEIEQSTRRQSQFSLWHSVGQYRVTVSYFGGVRHRLPTTSP